MIPGLPPILSSDKEERMNTKCIIITSIFDPSVPIYHYATKDDWDLIMVADTKTPVEKYQGMMNCQVLTLKKQPQLFPELANLVPLNHYARKNLGYMYAIQQGYQLIAETDDDNFPFTNWAKQHNLSKSPKLVLGPKLLNVYRLFTNQHIWPRGFPLANINDQKSIHTCKGSITNLSSVWIWQSLVDLDPDVDAIYRLTSPDYNQDFSFMGRESVILDRGVVCPFNTQNTLWLKPKAFDLLYLPCTVSMRFCDILKSYVAQYGLWAKGGLLGFTAPTAKQERNEHDLFKDFLEETDMYRLVPKVIQLLDEYKFQGDGQDLVRIYSLFAHHGIVQKEEIPIVKEWCRLTKR